MIKAAGYKKRIIQRCKDAGTYAPFYDDTYDKLAYLLELYDKAKAQFKESGERPIVLKTNSAGKKYLDENPAMANVRKLSAEILTHYDKIGLTPQGFKKLGGAMQKEDENSFAKILADLGI